MLYYPMEVDSAMTTLNISLPEPMRAFIEQKVAQGAYGSASEYIRQLIRDDQQRAAKERLELLLMEGLESGPPIEMTAEHWDELKRRVWQRHAEGDKQ
jgi:antitoxin ParD1/3/4